MDTGQTMLDDAKCKRKTWSGYFYKKKKRAASFDVNQPDHKSVEERF